MKRSRETTKVHIPDEIMASEILLRLPVQSLLRFKYVSKSWHALISDPSFTSQHLDQSKKHPKLAFVREEGDEINLCEVSLDSSDFIQFFGGKFSYVPSQLPLHSNGLLLLQSGRILHVCNPFTRETAPLPGFKSYFHRVGFGFVPCTNVYKVARYFYSWYSVLSERYSLTFEVFTLGLDSHWRPVAEGPPHPIDPRSRPISTSGGTLYFKIFEHLSEYSDEFILSFSLKHENFTEIPLPSPIGIIRRLTDFELHELGGNLCVVEKYWYGDEFDIWMYKGETWEHLYNIEFNETRTDDELYLVRNLYPLQVRCGKLLICIDDYINTRLARYDPETRQIRDVIVISGKRKRVSPVSSVRVFSYVESLVSLPEFVSCEQS